MDYSNLLGRIRAKNLTQASVAQKISFLKYLRLILNLKLIQ